MPPPLARILRSTRTWIAAAFCAVLALGLWGYSGSQASGETWFWARALYATLQMFFVEFNLLDDRDSDNGALLAARWLAVGVSAAAIMRAGYELFRGQWTSWRIGRLRNHYVICGLGRKGAHLVAKQHKAKFPVVAIERDENNPHVAACRELGVPVVIGDATLRDTLAKANAAHAFAVVATCARDGDNLEIALAANRLAQEVQPPRAAQLHCFVHIQDADLIEDLRSEDKQEALAARPFSHYENSVRSALAAAPLEVFPGSTTVPTQVRLVIAGFGSMGQAFALHAARIGHFREGITLAITVVDPCVEELAQSFLARYPQFPEVCELTFEPLALDHADVRRKLGDWVQEGQTRLAIAICADDSHLAASLARRLPRAVQQGPVTVYVRQNDERRVSRLFARDGGPRQAALVPFGWTDADTAFDPQEYAQLDTIARAAHEFYVAQANPPDPQHPAQQPWETLGAGYKNSNRQLADHIDIKLRTIGCRRVPQGKADAARRVTAFTDDEVELLAKMEHARWCAERHLSGWQYAPTRDNDRKLHPCLLPWAQLDEPNRDKDRNTVRDLFAMLARAKQEVERIV